MKNSEMLGDQRRTLTAENCQLRWLDEEKRTVELSFSSEHPVLRYFGWEVLSHAPEAIDMSRLNSGAALLAEHDTGKQIGVVERAMVENGRGKAVVRFSANSALANEYFGDVKDGIRRNISFGYTVEDAMITGTKDGHDVVTVTRWMPYEISIVSVPADKTVGVGRQLNRKERAVKDENSKTKEETRNESTPQTVDVQAVREAAIKEARKEEQKRAQEINAVAAQFGKNELASRAIEEGKSVDEFRAVVLESFRKQKEVDATAGYIGLSEKETREFSFMRAIRALANPTDRRAQDAAAFEFEVSLEAQKRSGVEAQGLLVPFDVLNRDMSVTGVGATGGKTVATNLLSGSFIELMRNRSAVMQAATILSGLSGNIAIPKQLSSSTVQNLTEMGEITDSEITFGQINMGPRRAGASVPYSKQLLVQSSLDIENLIRGDLLNQIALKIDWNALNGDGTGEMPMGIRKTTGVGLVPLGDNGGAPTWADFVKMETEISVDNADVEAMMYLLNARGRGYVKTKEKATGFPAYIGDGNAINGYGYRVSNQVPANLTKGGGSGLSNITFGNFADLIIGFWGGIDLIVDPYSRKKEGMIEITADQFYDVAVRRAESFSIIEDAVL